MSWYKLKTIQPSADDDDDAFVCVRSCYTSWQKQVPRLKCIVSTSVKPFTFLVLRLLRSRFSIQNNHVINKLKSMVLF